MQNETILAAFIGVIVGVAIFAIIMWWENRPKKCKHKYWATGNSFLCAHTDGFRVYGRKCRFCDHYDVYAEKAK